VPTVGKNLGSYSQLAAEMKEVSHQLVHSHHHRDGDGGDDGGGDDGGADAGQLVDNDHHGGGGDISSMLMNSSPSNNVGGFKSCTLELSIDVLIYLTLNQSVTFVWILTGTNIRIYSCQENDANEYPNILV